MPYLIGTDEAGYGPNLGPLVIAASVWEVPGNPRDCDLYKLLRRIVAREDSQKRWAIADSKLLYKPGQLTVLERNLLCAMALCGKSFATCRELWNSLDPLAAPQWEDLPWHATHDAALPICAKLSDVQSLAARVEEKLQSIGVRLVKVSATAIFPARFNALVDEFGSKGEALSQATLQLIGRVLQDLPAGPTVISCDKHGGRGKYQRLLQLQFPDPLIEVVCEGLQESIYRWGPEDARFEARFCAKGESFLPAALASMTAKYLRELSMHAFNEYWQKEVAGLKPTAGYPLDARRFKTEIAARQATLGIEDRVLWRSR